MGHSFELRDVGTVTFQYWEMNEEAKTEQLLQFKTVHLDVQT